MPSKKQKKNDTVMEINVPDSSNFMVPVAILISAVIVAIAIVYTGSKLDSSGTTLGVTGQSEETTEDNGGEAGGDTQTAAEAPGDVLGEVVTFTEYDTEICKEDGKPVVYLFSTTWCPHCEWISDTFDSWAKDNADKVVAYHWELDTNDDTLTSDKESEVPADHQAVYESFNPNGSIPTFVFGCKYGRVGNGYESEDDLQKEREAFDKIVKEMI